MTSNKADDEIPIYRVNEDEEEIEDNIRVNEVEYNLKLDGFRNNWSDTDKSIPTIFSNTSDGLPVLAPGSRNQIHGSKDLFAGSQDLVHESHDLVPRAQDLGPGSQDLVPLHHDHDSGPEIPDYDPLSLHHDHPSLQHDHPNLQPGLPSLHPGPSSLLHGPPSLHPGSSSLHHGPPILHHGPSSLVHGPPSLHPGSSSLHHGPPILHHGSPSLLHGHPSLHPGSSSLHHGPPILHHGSPSLLHGPPILNPGSSILETGSSSSDKVNFPGFTPSPPSYEEASHISRLSYVDFTPNCTGEGGILTTPTFERFSILVQRANEWLLLHPLIAGHRLETVEYETDDVTFGTSVDTTAVSRYGHGHHGIFCLKILRLWVVPRCVSSIEGCPQFGYINVVPVCDDPGGITRKPHFEPLDLTIRKLNELFSIKPLPGKIVSIERISTKFRQHSKWIDADRCHFHDRDESPVCHLNILRVFYESGPPQPTIIDFKDFLPKTSTLNNSNTSTSGDTFQDLVKEGYDWLESNSFVSFINFQTLLCSVKPTAIPDTNKTLTFSYRSPDYLQIFRIWVQLNSGQVSPSIESWMYYSPSVESICQINHGRWHCRTFCPKRIDAESMFSSSMYENFPSVSDRVADWLLNNSNFLIVSVETVCLKLDFGERLSDGEETFLHHSSGDDKSWIRAIRVYYSSSSGHQVEKFMEDSDFNEMEKIVESKKKKVPTATLR